MAYRATEESSSQSPEERIAEARRIIFDLDLVNDVEQMTETEKNFVSRLASDLEIADVPVSVKQLWWLRDLREKYS